MRLFHRHDWYVTLRESHVKQLPDGMWTSTCGADAGVAMYHFACSGCPKTKKHHACWEQDLEYR